MDPALQTYARVVPGRLGRPHLLRVPKEALDALGMGAGGTVRLELLPGDRLALAPDPVAVHVMRFGRPGGNPTVAVGALLRLPNEEAPLSREPLDAEVAGGSLVVHLRRPLPEAVYRGRRWRSYRREGGPMGAAGAEHRGAARRWSEVEMLDLLGLAWLAFGRAPTGGTCDRLPALPHSKTVRERFGGFERAVALSRPARDRLEREGVTREEARRRVGADGPTHRLVPLRLDAALGARVDAEAARRGVSPAALARLALERLLGEGQT